MVCPFVFVPYSCTQNQSSFPQYPSGEQGYNHSNHWLFFFNFILSTINVISMCLRA